MQSYIHFVLTKLGQCTFGVRPVYRVDPFLPLKRQKYFNIIINISEKER